MKAIAIDDEPIALDIIKQYCQRKGDIQLETFTSPVWACNAFSNGNPTSCFSTSK